LSIALTVPLMFRSEAEAGVTPDGASGAPRPRIDNTMVKALARAFLWRTLDEGVHATLDDLAKAKGVAPSYVSRVLRLTLVAPETAARLCSSAASVRECALTPQRSGRPA